MGFQQGLSGLNSASRSLDVIGNNVANSNTAGFKVSQAQFADVFAASLGGAGGAQIGIGTSLATVAQQFTQGNINVTNNPLDVAINGGGFFRLSDNGAISYTRNGQFQVDKDGYLVNSNGYNLTGYNASATGAILPSAPVDLRINSSDLQPASTSAVKAGVNMDSRETVPVTPVFNTTDPTSFNSSTSLSVYDSLGNPHVMAMYFVRQAAANTWSVYADVDGAGIGSVDLGGGAGNPVTLAFNSSGILQTGMPLAASVDLAAIDPTNGAASPLGFDMDFSGTTQFGSPFGVNFLSQDGYTSGRLTNIGIGADGVILGRYSNGQSLSLAQVVLATFTNNQGLQPVGENQWAETSQSGPPLIGAPNTGALGVLQSAAVEEANVDLTAELVNMITAQRVYQANAQTIKTQDSVLQTLVNLR